MKRRRLKIASASPPQTAPERAIHFRHALKNTLVPVITITGLQLGAIIAFAIITETVFQWPGLGALFVQAVQFVDIPVMAAYLMFVALVFVIVNLAVDQIYIALDPRLRGPATAHASSNCACRAPATNRSRAPAAASSPPCARCAKRAKTNCCGNRNPVSPRSSSTA